MSIPDEEGNTIEPDPAVPRFIPTVWEFGCKFEG